MMHARRPFHRLFGLLLCCVAGLCLAGFGPAPSPPAPAGERAAGFGIRPYLTQPGRTEMTVAWTSPVSTDFTLRYGQGPTLDHQVTVTAEPEPFTWVIGPAPGAASQPTTTVPAEAQKAAEYQYLAHLTGLKPGATCRYEVTGAGATAAGSFVPFAAPGEAFTFIAYGDSQDPERHRWVAAGFAQWQPRFLLHVGDMTNNGGYYPLWQRGFFGPLGALAASVPVQPALGNHDSASLMLRLFRRPEGRVRYSYDCGDAHFVCLDSFAGRTERPKMLEWCERDLAASRARWKIVYGHFPSYDAGSHGTAWGRSDFLPLFRKYGVDLVFAGHTHTYQRWRPMFTTGENERHPITYIVTGGGGGDLNRLAKDPYLAAGASAHHYLLITVTRDELRLRAVTPEGQELDAFRLRKDAQGRLDPDYLAQAVPEEGWGALRAQVWPAVSKLTLSGDLRTGRPATTRMDLGAGDRAMHFTVQLEPRAAEVYTMRPVSGRSPAGGTVAVEVEIRLREPDRYADPAVPLPVLRLECIFEIDGQTASVFSNRLLWRAPAPAAASP